LARDATARQGTFLSLGVCKRAFGPKQKEEQNGLKNSERHGSFVEFHYVNDRYEESRTEEVVRQLE